jgi:hypothetical protein
MRFHSCCRALPRAGLALHLLLSVAASSHAAAPAPDYRLQDSSACKRAPVRPPAPFKESYTRYKVERRFIDVDDSGNCVLMDFWIERLGGSAAVGMRTLEHRFLRPTGRKWTQFEADLRYFPHVLRRASDNALILVDSPTEQDIGDSMVLPTGEPRLFTAAGWDEDGTRLALLPADDRRAEVLDALAALLADAKKSAR